MSGPRVDSWRRAALAAAAALLVMAGAVPAQEAPPSTPAPSPSSPPAPEAAPPSPAPAPTPLPVLMGPAYETLRALAAGLAEEMGHVLDGTQEAVAMGRPARMFLPGIRMFKRRAEWFRNSVDKYRTAPFDVVGAASMMHVRAGMLGRRARRNEALKQTWEDWDAALALLDGIKRLLAGETVTVPSPHARRPAAAPTPARAPSPR